MKIKMNKITGLTIAISMILTSLYYSIFIISDHFGSSSILRLKYVLCWMGIVEILFIIYTWKKNNKKIVSLYILFMVFFFLFNYGQCIFWAFNIHTNTEIGKISLYYRLGIPTSYDIVKSQVLILISALMIHIGSMIVSNKTKTNAIKQETNSDNDKLLSFCKIIFLPVVFSEFYYQIVNIINAKMYGYTGLYYNADVQGVNVIFKILARLFLPVLLGLLFSSNYNKKIIKVAYFTFLIDIVLSVMVGDRGGWLYSAMILLICHNNYCSKFKTRQILSFSIIGYFGSIVLVAVRNIRNYGVSISGIINSVAKSTTSPVVDTLNEMGGTMGITTALMMRGWKIFPYGNSFFYGFIIAPSKRIISILNLNYESVSSWFSQTYLHISNGAAFSIVGEVLINYGPYFLPVAMIIIGIIINTITSIDDLDFKYNKIEIFYKVITTSVIINISRNCFSYNMGEIFYTTILFYVLFFIYRSLVKTRGVVNEK